ncbi:MAG: TonB-dependent receptor [Saprospiraceae bacterium]
MKKCLLFSLLGLGCSLSLIAQRPAWSGAASGPSITGKISGTLIDSITSNAVEFATIVLVNAKMGKEIDGTLTDEKGEFKLTEVKLGTYELRFSFLGYQTKTIKDITLTPEKPDVNLGDIFMLGEGVNLETVEVVGEAAVIENRIDKMVYNAEKDITNIGGDASDVLARVPMLAVDMDGKVSLRGSSNIQILINGKPSTMFSSDPGEALKSIPADQIKTVEVITVPTARYDGEGTGGIVNIITKKSNIQGFTGSVNTSVGTRSNRSGLNVNLVKGRFGLNGGGNVSYSWPNPSYNSFFREDYIGQQVRTLTQNGSGKSNYLGGGFNFGSFYDINAYNSINSSLNFRGRGGGNDGTTIANFDDPINNIYQDYTRTNDVSSLNGSFDWTSDYRKTYKGSEKEFSIAFQLSGNVSTSDNTLLQESPNTPELFLEEVNTNDGLNLEYTFQTDYIHPFGGKIKLETGAKAVIRRIDSDFQLEYFDQDQGLYLINGGRTDVFNYFQDVWAGYASFNFTLSEKYGLITGLRYEHTTISGEFDKFDAPFENQYDNFLPSFILNRKLGKFSNLRLSYTKRIQRPSLYYINPFVNRSDPRDISFGNPELLPENTDAYELGYNTFIKGVVFNASVYYRLTNDVIESLLDVDANGVSFTAYQNIGKRESIGINGFASATIKKIWTLRGGFDLLSYEGQGIVDGQRISRQAWQWKVNLSSTFKFNKGYTVQLFGFYNSPQQSLQGTRGTFSMFSMGFQKEFTKRTSLGLNIFQPFNRTLKFPSALEGANFYQKSEREIVLRSIGVNFRHSFGKLDFKQPRQRRSRINNDDLKQGSDGNEGNMN